MEDVILETANWSVRASRIAFSMMDTDHPDVKEEFSVREVVLPEPLDAFLNEMVADYLVDICEHLGADHPYYRDTRRYLQLRAWLKGQHDQRSKVSQPRFYIPYQEYWREVLSTITGQEQEARLRSQPLTVHDLEILAHELHDDAQEDEDRLRLARWGIGRPPRLSRQEEGRLRGELKRFWLQFDKIMGNYQGAKVDMQSAEEQVRELWCFSRKITVRDEESGRDIPISQFILDSMNDEFLEFLNWAFDRLSEMISSRLSREEQDWFEWLYSCQPQFGGLMPGVSPVIGNFLAWIGDEIYLPVLVYAFGMKMWRGLDLEGKLGKRWNTYLILYALQRGRAGEFVTRDEDKWKKKPQEVHIGSEDALDRLSCEASAPEIEDIVLRKIRREEIMKEIAAKLTPREKELVELLLEGRNLTDAASEMSITPQRASQLRAQIRKKFRRSHAGRDDDHLLSEVLTPD